jgi:hypothetical protein
MTHKSQAFFLGTILMFASVTILLFNGNGVNSQVQEKGIRPTTETRAARTQSADLSDRSTGQDPSTRMPVKDPCLTVPDSPVCFNLKIARLTKRVEDLDIALNNLANKRVESLEVALNNLANRSSAVPPLPSNLDSRLRATENTLKRLQSQIGRQHTNPKGDGFEDLWSEIDRINQKLNRLRS